MVQTEPNARPSAAAAFGAALFVVATLAVLYWKVSGDGSPDWDGYGRLFDDEGGWLLRTGREPGFVWFISQARELFGQDNYDGFRLVLFCIFTAFAAWLAIKMPVQSAIQPITSLAVALIVILAFLLKGLVQIREGLAFLFVVVPAVAIFRDEKVGQIRAGIGGFIAGIIHAATALFFVAWIAAIGVWLLPDRWVATAILQRVLFVVSLALGAVLAFTVLRNFDAIQFLLQDFGVDRWSETQVALWKYAYWLVNGVIVLVLRHQLIKSVGTAPKFAFAYATAIGTVLLPAVYAICLTLVLTNFQMGAVISMAIRIFLTVSEATLIIIALRGRADLGTVAIALAMLADRARLLIVA